MEPIVENIKIQYNVIDPSLKPVMNDLYGISELPLCPAELDFDLKGVNYAISNAIRRVMCDELPSYCLAIDESIMTSEQCNDPFMFDQVVRGRIQLIPLVLGITDEIAKSIKFDLDFENKETYPLYVHSGDMRMVSGRQTKPIFNPTFRLALLQPSTYIHLKNIFITSGIGRDNAAYQLMCQTSSVALDIPMYPKDQTHPCSAPHEGESGYTVSTLVADPHDYQIHGVIPATYPNDDERILQVPIRACQNIIDRLRMIYNALTEKQREEVVFTPFSEKSAQNESLLKVKGETHTIGNLLTKMIFDHYPELKFVGYTCNRFENEMKLTITHDASIDCQKVLFETIDRCIKIMEKIKTQFISKRKK